MTNSAPTVSVPLSNNPVTAAKVIGIIEIAAYKRLINAGAQKGHAKAISLRFSKAYTKLAATLAEIPPEVLAEANKA